LVNLVNTDGLVLIGPGSEWFWSMAQFVLVALTLIGIYYQLRDARSASAFDQVNRIADEWESERAVRHKLAISRALHDGVAAEDVPEGAASWLSDFWERLAGLVREGHVDRKVVHDDLGASCQVWWLVLAPNIRRYRAETGSNSGEHFEWLAGAMAEIDRKAGQPVIAIESFVGNLDRRIQKFQEQVSLFEELRSVVTR
jgi:hypothetical protein